MSDQKYRQRGYKDSDAGESRGRSGPAPPREKKEGPRGRGLGAPTETVFRCAVCNYKQVLPEEVPFDAACAKCGAALHTCANCVHFDTGVRWECRRHAEIPARVPRKREANSCPLFTPKATQEFGQDRDQPSPTDARSAFDALFKKF